MDYSDANFGKMQEEAVRRVMEMQQRSRSAVGGDRQPTPPPQKDPPNDIFGGLLGGIKLDEEKALIALLIYNCCWGLHICFCKRFCRLQSLFFFI